MKNRMIAGTLAGLCLLTVLPRNAGAVGTSTPGRDHTIAQSVSTSFAIREDGTLWAWGNNYFGTVGNVLSVKERALEPTPVQVETNARSVSSGMYSTVLLKDDGSVWTWGTNKVGVLGISEPDTGRYGDFKHRQILTGISAVGTSDDIAYAIKPDGSLWAWGMNLNGLMDPDPEAAAKTYASPTQVMTDVAGMSPGGNLSYFIKTDGSLWGTGTNGFGALGIVEEKGDPLYMYTELRFSPVHIMDGVEQAAADVASGAALKPDGSLWIWGNLAVLLSQNPLIANRPTPEKLMDNVSTFAMEANYLLAVKNDGTLWACGINRDRQLGDGTTETRYTPVKVMENVVDVAVSNNIVLALKNDGTLWQWGQDVCKPHGDGTYDLTDPHQVLDKVRLPENRGTFSPAPVSETPVPAPTVPSPTVPSVAAKASTAKVRLDGVETPLAAYEIEGNNYFKLRDLAYVLSGSGKQFSVDYDAAAGAISLVSGQPYSEVGGELQGVASGSASAQPSAQTVLLNGKPLSVTAYAINGNNYFKLRDLGAALNFSVQWDGATGDILIETMLPYQG